MDYELHPYRYITGMKKALARFERIHADHKTSEHDRTMELGMPDTLR